jgi:hypothetical protein
MPAKLRPAEFRWKDETEKEYLTRQAQQAGLSLGNFIRAKLGLGLLKTGRRKQSRKREIDEPERD